jgi:hypothetical protein
VFHPGQALTDVCAHPTRGELVTGRRISTPLKADEFLATLNKLNITVDPDSSNRILTDTHRLAVTYRLTSYDASYLELAGPPIKAATGNGNYNTAAPCSSTAGSSDG